MWMIGVGILGLAALVGQKEAALLLVCWIIWPVIRQMFQKTKKETGVEKGKKVEAVEAEIIHPHPPARTRGSLPRTTRPELPDPDVVDAEFRELPPPRPPKWRQVVGAGLFFLGLSLIALGTLGFLAGLLGK